MASINVINILVLDPKTKFTNQFKFEIVFECLSELKEGISINKSDIEWKIIYIGNSEDESYDQVLDAVLIGPLQLGSMKFLFEVFNYFN